MNTLVIVLIAAVVLVCAYAGYGRWLAKTWGVDPNAKTPAVRLEDGTVEICFMKSGATDRTIRSWTELSICVSL